MPPTIATELPPEKPVGKAIEKVALGKFTPEFFYGDMSNDADVSIARACRIILG